MKTLEDLNKRMSLCQRCELRKSATQPVPGWGSLGAKYFLLGEAPGHNEDRAMMPFVGLAGKRLNKLLALSGIDPNDCYLSNTCRCLPPLADDGKVRKPKKSERLLCYGWLKEELKIVHPQVVIPLGSVPLSMFTDTGISQLHGTTFKFVLELENESLPVVVAPQYHPAYALHNPKMWAVLLDDWEHPPVQINHNFTVVSSNVFGRIKQ